MKKNIIFAFVVGFLFFNLAHADATTTPTDASSTPPIATSTPPIASPTPPVVPDIATITIRDGSTTAFSGIITLPDASSSNVQIIPTNSSTSEPVAARSLLSTLVALDASSSAFDITDLQFFPSFNSFIINCIAIPSGATPDCFNWTDAINGTFPQVGMDKQLLHNGDTAILFFGSPRQTILSTSTVEAGQSFTAIAQQYDLSSGNYIPAPGLTLGVVIPNPDFTFTELATSTTDSSGQAIFTINATGTFSVGIHEDGYFPNASITISDAPATSTASTSTPPEASNPPSPPPSSGGGGGISHLTFNVANALAFLSHKQFSDGSFGASYLSDWAAIAFAASDPGNAKTVLKQYLLSAAPTLSSATDYERHAMALEALGIDPYTGTSHDYVTPIVNAFDGNQIGDPHLDNDDIFALFPLLHAGYTEGDDIIQKTTAYILSAQNTNGAWDASVDITSAAIQALEVVNTMPDVGPAIARAKAYLHTQQSNNGGFGNDFSTSWAMQAIAAFNEMPTEWAPIGYSAEDYLAGFQQNDGGVELISALNDTRMWATEYAIPAALGKTWGSLLTSFPKPAEPTTGTSASSGGGAVLGASTTTLSTGSGQAVATSTPEIVDASSTPPVATTTPPIATTTPISDASASTTPIAETPKPQAKKVVAPKAPAEPVITNPAPTQDTLQAPELEVQTAAAAAPEQLSNDGSLLSRVWGAVTYFFSHLF